MHDLQAASLQSTDSRLSFCPLIVWVHNCLYTATSGKSYIRIKWRVTVIQDHSRSSKSVPIAIHCVTYVRLPLYLQYMPNVYLLSCPRYNSNDLLVEILYSFAVLPTPGAFEALARKFLRTQVIKFSVRTTSSWANSESRIILRHQS